MPLQRRRREIVLFLIALILPSAVLVGLGLRMIAQERELAETRVADEWLSAVGRIRQEILNRLEGIKLQELRADASDDEYATAYSYVNPEVRLVASVDDGRLVLPWEVGGTTGVRRLLAESGFASWIRQGERAEFRRDDYRTAIESYARALERGRFPVQSGYARLSLARALAGAGREQDAWSHYRQALSPPSTVRDEQGIPLALYAAASLLAARQGPGLVLDRIESELAGHDWLAPSRAYMIRDLLDTLVATVSELSVLSRAVELQSLVVADLPRAELALTLQRDFSRLGLRYPMFWDETPEPRWIPFNDGGWLVSSGSLSGTTSPRVLAVDADAVLVQLQDTTLWPGGQIGQVRARAGGEGRGLLLGASLPGLEVVFQGSGADGGVWGVQRSLYGIALLLVLSITFFGAFLVWRDVRRELRLADLRSQFVASVSHELKTPLTSIRMFAETLLARESPDPQTRADYLGTIVGESERLTRLLNNVLNLSKIEQDRMIYRRRPTSLADVADRAARALEYLLEQSGFTLNVTSHDEIPPISVDPDAVEQAILNLLTNAMKYSGDSREIDLRLGLDDGHAVIEVTDRGQGIAPHELGRLTEKFYRVPTPENESVPGTGLGLTLVEHMAKAHGGDLRARSVIGEGSTFEIRLPLEAER